MLTTTFFCKNPAFFKRENQDTDQHFGFSISQILQKRTVINPKKNSVHKYIRGQLQTRPTIMGLQNRALVRTSPSLISLLGTMLGTTSSNYGHLINSGARLPNCYFFVSDRLAYNRGCTLFFQCYFSGDVGHHWRNYWSLHWLSHFFLDFGLHSPISIVTGVLTLFCQCYKHTCPPSCNGVQGGKPKRVGVRRNWKKGVGEWKFIFPCMLSVGVLRRYPPVLDPKDLGIREKNQEFQGFFRNIQEKSGIFRKYQEKSGKIRKNQEFSGISNTWGTWG